MALFGHLQLFSILLGTFLSFCLLLYECKKLDGYKFPVYSTEFCPRNQTEWNERSSAINCTKDNGYLCFPNEKFTQLLEFCFKDPFIWIQEGYCLYLKKDDSTIYSYSCSSFQSGCHNSSFQSYELFKHSSCTSIGNGCFLAKPSCKGSDTATSLPETTKPTHVEIVTRNDTTTLSTIHVENVTMNYITTASIDEKTNQTLKYNDYFIYDEVFMMPILAGVLIPIIIFCMLCIFYRKEFPTSIRHNDIENQEDESTIQLDVTESMPEGYTLVTNNNNRTAVRVCESKKCCRDVEFYCFTCELEMCLSCMEDHVNDFYEKEHQVEICRAKINLSTIDEYCAMHSKLYRMYCKECKVPTCPACIHPEDHSDNDITESYQVKRKQVIRTVITIRTDAIFHRKVLLAGIIPDFKTSQNQFKIYQSEMLTKAQTLKHLIEYIQKDFMCNVFCDFNFKHRCLKQKKEMVRHIVSLQEYELRYEQQECTFSALQFLSSIKTTLTQIHAKLHTSQLSMTESLNKEGVMESLSTIQITVRGTRQLAKDQLLTLMPAPKIRKRVEITDITRCYHISIVKIGQVCVNDSNKLILINDVDKTQRQVKAEFSASFFCGMHAVSKEKKLYFIDKENNINQLSDDMSTTTTIVKKTDDKEKPMSFCISWSTGDLLVGKLHKVERYKHNGELKQIIPDMSEGCKLFGRPYYITENKNEDIVVSDFSKCAVIVTDMRGRHRFSYTGSPPNALNPMGICTDVLSHILVWDYTSRTVQILDKDGQFLNTLLESSHLGSSLKSCSLSYDVNTHYLWVGSEDTTVRVYKYITRK